MKRKRFILTLLADVLFVIGLAAIVVGIAMAGNVPLAVSVAGVELAVTAVLGSSALADREDGEDG